MNWPRHLFRPRPDPAAVAAAYAEQAHIDATVWPIFQANLGPFKLHVAEGHLMSLGYGPINYIAARDMFLWGLIATAIAERPALPTPIYDRIGLYLTRYFVCVEGKTLMEAKRRARRAREQFQPVDAVQAAFVEAGAAAFASGGDQHLRETWVAMKRVRPPRGN